MLWKISAMELNWMSLFVCVEAKISNAVSANHIENLGPYRFWKSQRTQQLFLVVFCYIFIIVKFFVICQSFDVSTNLTHHEFWKFRWVFFNNLQLGVSFTVTDFMMASCKNSNRFQVIWINRTEKNSKFYNTCISNFKIYVDMLLVIGFSKFQRI